MLDVSFYYVKISCPKALDNETQSFKVLMENLVNKNPILDFKFSNIPNRLAEAKVGDFVFLHIGGDYANKRTYFQDTPSLQNYENGIYAIGKLKQAHLSEKEIDLDIYPLNSCATKMDLYIFPQFLDNLGCATKGTPNQAGLYELTANQALSFIEYLSKNDSLGLASELVKSLPYADALSDGIKDFIKENPAFSERETNKLLAKHISGLVGDKLINRASHHTRLNVDLLTLSKPFLLLAGLSGTGKTRFVREQANYSGQFNETYCLTSVRPDWHEPSDLLGYISRLNGSAEYITTDVLQFIAKAWRGIANNGLTIDVQDVEGHGERLVVAGNRDALNQVLPYWLCLDEMNLAPVEQYFADYLSVLETREWCWENDSFTYTCDALLKPATIQEVADKNKLRRELGFEAPDYDELWDLICQYGLSIPFNLMVAGTVNMDETTHGFSRKVIDRALSFDFGAFFPNYYDAFFVPTSCNKQFSYPIWSQAKQSDLTNTCDTDGSKTVAFLTAVNTVLKNTPFELAYRALNELLLAVVSNNPQDDLTLKAVWDDFLMCKVLPRIEGDNDKLTTLNSSGDKKEILAELNNILATQLAPIWDADEQDVSNQRPDLYREKKEGETDDTKIIRIPCRSKDKLTWMQQRLTSATFTSFWP